MYNSSQMNPELYKSAQDGNIDNLRKQLDVLVGNNGRLTEQLTTSNGNLLHVLSQFGDFEGCVHGILDTPNFEDQQVMVTWQNSLDETALHVASRNGHALIVGALIKCAQALDSSDLESDAQTTKEMMRAVDKDGNTALHNAVNNKREDVVQLLVSADPKFEHPANKMEQTPLYLAVERRQDKIVELICSSPAYIDHGTKTALHAVLDQCSDRMSASLRKNLELAEQADTLGWIPLHVAAYTDQTWLMEKLLEYCPDCWDVVTSKSQNVLHLAALSKKGWALEFILKQRWAINLVNQKDADGNTPLHLLLANYSPLWSADTIITLINYHQADPNAINKEGFTPRDLVEKQEINSDEKDRILKLLSLLNANEEQRSLIHNIVKERKENKTNRGEDKKREETEYELQASEELRNGEDKKRQRTKYEQNVSEELRKFGDTQLIVATLIATVTFAAGFTLPGGYDGNEGPNQGMAVLIKKAAFKTFVVSDTVAVTSSILSVFLHFAAAFSWVSDSLDTDEEKEEKLLKLYTAAMIFLLIAKIGMVITFVTGLYTALDEGSLGLAISVCCLGCISLLYIFYKFHRVMGLTDFLEYVWDELLGEWRETGCKVWKRCCCLKN